MYGDTENEDSFVILPVGIITMNSLVFILRDYKSIFNMQIGSLFYKLYFFSLRTQSTNTAYHEYVFITMHLDLTLPFYWSHKYHYI